MAWVAEDLFNSYSDGDLNTLNGGSNFTAAWVADTAADVQGSTINEGAKAIQFGAFATDGIARRDFTAVTAGTMYFSVRLSQTNKDFAFSLRESGTGRMFIRFGADGNIAIFDNASYTTIQAYSADTWYRIGVDFDNSGQPNLYRANVDNGSFTAYKTVSGGSYTNVDRLQFDFSAFASGGGFWDTISPNYDVTVATKKNLTLLGVG